MCFKQTANLLSLGANLLSVRSLLIISSRDCREADSRDTSTRHACVGEVSRNIWLHDFAINNNRGSVPVIFISLALAQWTEIGNASHLITESIEPKGNVHTTKRNGILAYN